MKSKKDLFHFLKVATVRPLSMNIQILLPTYLAKLTNTIYIVKHFAFFSPNNLSVLNISTPSFFTAACYFII